MRNTGGPGTFNVDGWQKIRSKVGPPHHNQQLGERPATRHGSDERSTLQGGRPVTQGQSRRALNQPPHVPSLATSSAVSGIGLTIGGTSDQVGLEMGPIDQTYVNDGAPKEVMNRRTSSRRMNRIYGGASSSSIKRIDHPNAPHIQHQREASPQNEGLPTVKNLPAGFDPIFNPGTKSKFVNDNSHIKIKPMRLSNGFEHQIDSMKSSKEAIFDNTGTSHHSGGGNVSRVSSIGTLDSQGPNMIQAQLELQVRADNNRLIQGSGSQSSSIYGGDNAPANLKVNGIEGKRKSLGKVHITQGHAPSGHFRKKIAQKNNRETAMESIIEEDESQVQHHHQKVPAALRDSNEDGNITRQLTSSLHRAKDLGKKSGSNGSTTLSSNFQLKNENELSTMQTSGGFSNTKRSPRDPSFESNQKRGGGGGAASDAQLHLRPQLISSQNYNSLHQLRPTDCDMGTFKPLPGANLTANGFSNIIEEEEFAYQDGKKQHHNDTAAQDSCRQRLKNPTASQSGKKSKRDLSSQHQTQASRVL